jgi:hypothetical protein
MAPVPPPPVPSIPGSRGGQVQPRGCAAPHSPTPPPLVGAAPQQRTAPLQPAPAPRQPRQPPDTPRPLPRWRGALPPPARGRGTARALPGWLQHAPTASGRASGSEICNGSTVNGHRSTVHGQRRGGWACGGWGGCLPPDTERSSLASAGACSPRAAAWPASAWASPPPIASCFSSGGDSPGGATVRTGSSVAWSHCTAAPRIIAACPAGTGEARGAWGSSSASSSSGPVAVVSLSSPLGGWARVAATASLATSLGSWSLASGSGPGPGLWAAPSG